MPPSLRRRGQPPQHALHESVSDSDDNNEAPVEWNEEDQPEEELSGLEEEGDLEAGEEEEGAEDDEDMGSTHSTYAHDPVPPNYREISTLASWTVSSSKPGCSIPQLRAPSTSLFWQSDGPQPHYLNIHFFKLVRIVALRLFLDFDNDESYTPTRIVFLAGSSQNDLVEWGEMRLEEPRGWIWADFSGVAEVDDDEPEEEQEQENLNGHGHGPEATRPSARAAGMSDNMSELENAQPTHSADWNDTIMTTDDETSVLNPPPHARSTHRQQELQQQHTPSTSSPSVQRNTRSQPRQPLANLPPVSPSQTITRKKKLPILRAHLVQIKILENHQNGKDTHLRGLQIFSLDNDAENDGSRGAGSMGVESEKKAKQPAVERKRRLMRDFKSEVRGEWNTEPNIR